MKKLIAAVLGLAVLLVGGLFLAPNIIDWNQYKGEIADKVRQATGRTVVFGGDIKVRVLPSPALKVDNVRFSNLSGAVAADMVSLRSLIVQVAFAPLLTGKVKIETVRLIDPIIDLEILADGRRNWDLGDSSGKPAAAPSAEAQKAKDMGAGVASADAEGAPLPVEVDAFHITNGTLVYRDGPGGSVERLDAVNVRLAAGSLIGPFDVQGHLVLRGIPLAVEVSLAKIIHGRTASFAVSGALGNNVAKGKFSGSLTKAAEGMTVKGKFRAEGGNLAALIGGFAGGGELPGLLGQDYALETSLAVGPDAVEATDIAFKLGAMQAKGTASAKLGKTIDGALNLAVSKFDAGEWLNKPPVATQAFVSGPAPEPVSESTSEGGKPKASLPLKGAKDGASPPAKAKPASAKGLDLPKNVNVTADIVIDAIAYNDGAIRQAKVSAALANGEITLSQLSAQLPGASDVFASGFVGAGADGAPRFEGTVEGRAADLRGLLKWLKVDASGVAPDRLRKLTVHSNLVASAGQASLTGLSLEADGSKLTGGVTLALTKRLAFGADLTLDKIVLDGYLPAKPAPTKPAPGGGATPAKGPAAVVAEADPFAGLKALGGFDANVKFKAGSVTYRGVPVADIRLDGTLARGTLTLREARIGDLAGASAQLSGRLGGLDGAPKAENLVVRIDAKDTARLFKLAAVEPPLPPAKIGAVSVNAKANGPLAKPSLDAEVTALGGKAKLAGIFSPAAALSGLELDAAVSHPDLNDLLQRLGVGYQPSGRIGAVDLAAHVKGTADALALSGLKGNLGNATLNGDLTAALTGPRPKLVANLKAGDVSVDPFVPASAAAPSASSRGGAAGGRAGVSAPASTGERWSRQPLDLSGLKAADADVKIQARGLTYGGTRVDNADLVLTLVDGTLDVSRLAGGVFGGGFDGKARLVAGKSSQFDSQVTVKGANVAQATRAVTGKEAATGTLDYNSRLTAQGASVYDLVSTLNGNGAFALRGVDMRSDSSSGSAMSGALNLLGALNSFGGTLGGGKGPKGGAADVTGSYTASRGIITSQDLTLKSGFGNGKAAGSADLPRWLMDVKGEVNMAGGLLTALLASKTGAPQVLPFSLNGPIDAPNVKLDTSKLGGGGLAVPDLKKKGVGGILEQVLPGATGGGATKPSSQPQPQQQKTKPQDLLKDILRGR